MSRRQEHSPRTALGLGLWIIVAAALWLAWPALSAYIGWAGRG